jgi:hypothetical protein
LVKSTLMGVKVRKVRPVIKGGELRVST